MLSSIITAAILLVLGYKGLTVLETYFKVKGGAYREHCEEAGQSKREDRPISGEGSSQERNQPVAKAQPQDSQGSEEDSQCTSDALIAQIWAKESQKQCLGG